MCGREAVAVALVICWTRIYVIYSMYLLDGGDCGYVNGPRISGSMVIGCVSPFSCADLSYPSGSFECSDGCVVWTVQGDAVLGEAQDVGPAVPGDQQCERVDAKGTGRRQGSTRQRQRAGKQGECQVKTRLQAFQTGRGFLGQREEGGETGPGSASDSTCGMWYVCMCMGLSLTRRLACVYVCVWSRWCTSNGRSGFATSSSR